MTEVPEAVRERIESDPYCEFLGVEVVDLGPGHARTELSVTESLCNFHGTVHGGAVYSLADAAFAAASNSRGETALALESNVSYLDSVGPGATLVADATETHVGGRTAEYAVRVSAEETGTDADADADDEDGEETRVATFRGRVYRPE